MPLDRSACFRALAARDRRFDGVFFVGVTSTGVYCRPVCTSRTPRAANCRFFSHPAAAERSGFRPCLRCRPELAPGHAPVDASAALAERAARAIAAGALNERSVEELASSLGVTARHLRRAVDAQLGVSPIELATTHRLLLAKRLLHESSLPVGQVAFAAGFASLRRFNAAFHAQYRLNPTTLRRAAATPHHASAPPGAWIELTLEYRPPLDWPALLRYLAARATVGVECVEGDAYYATINDPVPGELVLTHRARRGATAAARSMPGVVVARLSPSLLPALMPVLARVRDLLDLDADPRRIGQDLARAGLLRHASELRGARVPGTLDPFGLVVRTILGQQVSVKGASSLMARFVERFGTAYEGTHAGLARLMPSCRTIARARADDIAALGVTRVRAEAIIALARAVCDGSVSLTPGADATRSIRALVALPGIGDWTAQYVAMRALRWPDAFPAGDLVLRRAAGGLTPTQLLRHAEAWRPWRAYAAMHLWRTAPAPQTRNSSNASR